MNIKKYRNLLVTSCALTLMMGTGIVFAQNSSSYPDQNTNTESYQDQNTTTSRQNDSSTYDKTKQGVKNTWDKSKNAVENTAQDIKAWFMDETKQAEGTFPVQYTARGFLGKTAVSTANKNLGKIDDILLTPNGEARYLVVENKGFLGLTNKKVLVNYSSASRQESNGDILVPLTQDYVKQAKGFDLDDKDDPVGSQITSGSLLSVKDLIGADLISPRDDVDGEIDNISFKGGRADYIILSVNETLGMGGQKASLKFESAQWSHKDGKHRIQLTDTQAQRLKTISDQQKNTSGTRAR